MMILISGEYELHKTAVKSEHSDVGEVICLDTDPSRHSFRKRNNIQHDLGACRA
jgi:hypothetical protein